MGNDFWSKPLIWFRRLFQSALLVLTVSLMPCMVFWLRTGNSRGLGKNAAADMEGVRIQVNNSTVSVENFLIFMISVDYQPDMEEEALKAFAVTARSSLYAHLNRYFQEADVSDSGAESSNNSVKDTDTVNTGKTEQQYRTVNAGKLDVEYYEPGEMACAFGDAAELEGKEHWSDIYRYVKKAVELTGGQYLTYTEESGKTGTADTEDAAGSEIDAAEKADAGAVDTAGAASPVDALWHGYSAGNTRFYEGNLTGEDDGISLYSPQLKSMDGKDGQLARAVMITVYSRRELAKLMWEIPGTEDILEENNLLSSYIMIENRDSSGYIEEISLGNRKMTGEEAAKLLQVASGCFYVSDLSDDRLKIMTFGSGRGYGMSLAGASVMASQGADYREILEYYFPVCQVNNFSFLRTE
ncbi:MAG: SpoIID/LytB domain-containing protein [Lachnospiraceae bacterium]